jgi:SAM-dependent methyltransferase
MNKMTAADFAYATSFETTIEPRAPACATHPQALLELPAGEARASLLAVHDVLNATLPPTELAIYEAGGGSTSFLPLDVMRRAHTTVVDIDETQILNNDYADEKFLGDIQTYRFKSGSFDLIICYNVIEHLPDVESALTRFCEALKPNGLMLIGAPNPRSLSGLVTKYTPHWFHVWFYRHVRGHKDAGKPGEPPFPTFFHPLVTLPNLDAFARTHDLEMIYRREYESPRFPEMRERKPAFAALLDGFATVINRLLPNNTDARHGDYHVILRKR